MTTQPPSDLPISRYPVPDLNTLPDDLKEVVLKIQEKTGFVPNVFAAKAHRPEELRAFMVYHDALMNRESSLTKAEIEMIVVATSGANNCLYCVMAHGAILRIRAKDPLIADQIATNYHKANITPKQKAMLDFAMLVTMDSASIDETDFEAMYEYGFDDEDIWDIGSIAAFFAMSNRMANLVGIRPNAEFYTMGRDKR